MPGTVEWYMIVFQDYIEAKLKPFEYKLLVEVDELHHSYEELVATRRRIQLGSELDEFTPILDKRILKIEKRFRVNTLRLRTVDGTSKRDALDFKPEPRMFYLLNEYYERFRTGR